MVFACGDAAGMGRSLPEAMASGIAAADAVGRALHGTYIPGIKGGLFNAPDISAIYSENVQKIHRQTEQVIRSQGAEGTGNSLFTEDVLALVREAGIKEQMPAFLPYDDEGRTKQKVAVVGGGLSGITAAIDLAESRVHADDIRKRAGAGRQHQMAGFGKACGQGSAGQRTGKDREVGNIGDMQCAGRCDA